MASISLRKVVKRYGSGKTANQVIHGVDAEIKDGEFVVVVGPSGCGKSTLLRMVAGLEEISGGEIAIGERVVNDLEPSDRDIAMVFQNYALYPHMSVFDNMAYGLKIAKLPMEEIKERVAKAAKILELGPYMARRPRELSGGQRQRVAMGRAIVRQPQVFLFDEPLSNLDAALRVHMRAEISRLHKKFNHASAIYVTHDQTEAMAMADKIVLLRAGPDMAKYGSVAQIGTPMDLYHRPSNRFVAAFLGSPRMNFIEARVMGSDAAGLTLQIGAGETVTVPVDASALKAGGAVTLGLRPEHMHPVAPGSAECRMTRAVRQVERFGEYSYVYLTSDSAEALIAKVPGDCYTPCGEAMSFGFEPAHCHVFDAEGLALAHLAAH